MSDLYLGNEEYSQFKVGDRVKNQLQGYYLGIGTIIGRESYPDNEHVRYVVEMDSGKTLKLKGNCLEKLEEAVQGE